MNKERASRVINKEFLNDLKCGKLQELTNIVREDKSLLMCFRGDYINIYYRGRCMFRIEQQAKDYKISFNFNHAKFTIDWEEKKNQLEQMNYKLNKNELVIAVSKIIDANYFWKQSIELMKGFIDEFLDADIHINYINGKEEKKRDYLEKQRQQQIMKNNQDFQNNYFIYDREYTQPRTLNEEKKHGQIDLLALRKAKDKGIIVFIEVKSKKDPNKGKANIEKHYDDYIKYISNETFVQSRKLEAIEIIEHYIFLGLVDLDINEYKHNCRDMTTEMLYIFTDESIDYFRENKDNVPAKGIILDNENWRL